MGWIPLSRERASQSSSRSTTRIGQVWLYSGIVKFFPVVLCLLFSSYYLAFHADYSLFVDDATDCPPLPILSPGEQSPAQDPGRELVDTLKEATRVASGKLKNSTPEILSSEERRAWNSFNPCQSRGPRGLGSLYTQRKHAENVPSNPLWEEVFEEYSKLHRECTRKVGNIRDYFLQKNVTSGCKFVIADIADKTGIGNKILVLASSLLYAILTQRVILIPASTSVPSLMCEPFAGSSWILDDKSLPVPPTSFRDHWKLDKEMFAWIDGHRKQCSSPSIDPLVYAAGIRTNEWQPQPRFYCTREQSAYSEVTFVYLSGCIYTVPKLYRAPIFRPALEALFPNRIVVTHLLRSAFLPADAVWKRVQRHNQAYLQHANRRIGIQLRYNGRGLPSYWRMNDIINARIVDCLIENKMLPNVIDFSHSFALLPMKITPSATRPVVQVFIASLFEGLRDHISGMYVRSPTVTGEGVGVVQLTQNGHQEFSVEEDTEALTEALLLSFSDHLLVTPVSTFGSLAHAYGALTPWFIEARKNTWRHTYGACERGKTIEVCNQFVGKKDPCSSDLSAKGKSLANSLPYIQNCLTVDHEEGIELISSFRS